MFDYIFSRKIEQFFLFVASCKKPAKYIGNTFLLVTFPRFSRVVAFKLSSRYVSQTMSNLEQLVVVFQSRE